MPTADIPVAFQLNSNFYIARPLIPTTTLEEHSEHYPFVTCLRVQKNQTINASTLQAWRTEYLDEDDVFDSTFLQEIIFGGVKASELHVGNDAKELLKDWQTLVVRYEPDLDVSNGPHYCAQGYLHSVWKIYEGRQLPFVQATWPSAAGNRL
ncbi:hypothetical protein BU16DRAFT_581071 [Lophium mytilinum]|uniref:Scytalone dehydratase-like protein Arp1 N-terminal domain-containing protein n=1 Tax=Lophium mytilinum TaxID=390894 RepID=A0A6A6QXA7_9PEZI|nr:hypothetical protein BU16DRAFT_581071 [Lophium mytilinum]